jgi:hypothetical protein
VHLGKEVSSRVEQGLSCEAPQDTPRGPLRFGVLQQLAISSLGRDLKQLEDRS